MTHSRSTGTFVAGAAETGWTGVAERVFDKLVGFAAYGFPKVHAAAFCLLAYQLNAAAPLLPGRVPVPLLNEQPMGFYPTATLVGDAQRPGCACCRWMST